VTHESAQGARLSGRFLLTESVGALGDLGTFIPIVVGLVQIVGLDAATVLVLAGLMNVVTGLFFRIPIAVQPMKAIAAPALGGALTAGQVTVAGLSAGILLLLMGLTGLITWLAGAAGLAHLEGPVVFGIVLAVTFLPVCCWVGRRWHGCRRSPWRSSACSLWWRGRS